MVNYKKGRNYEVHFVFSLSRTHFSTHVCEGSRMTWNIRVSNDYALIWDRSVFQVPFSVKRSENTLST